MPLLIECARRSKASKTWSVSRHLQCCCGFSHEYLPTDLRGLDRRDRTLPRTFAGDRGYSRRFLERRLHAAYLCPTLERNYRPGMPGLLQARGFESDGI